MIFHEFWAFIDFRHSTWLAYPLLCVFTSLSLTIFNSPKQVVINTTTISFGAYLLMDIFAILNAKCYYKLNNFTIEIIIIVREQTPRYQLRWTVAFMQN
jgi:hypothetical protein